MDCPVKLHFAINAMHHGCLSVRLRSSQSKTTGYDALSMVGICRYLQPIHRDIAHGWGCGTPYGVLWGSHRAPIGLPEAPKPPILAGPGGYPEEHLGQGGSGPGVRAPEMSHLGGSPKMPEKAPRAGGAPIFVIFWKPGSYRLEKKK